MWNGVRLGSSFSQICWGPEFWFSPVGVDANLFLSMIKGRLRPIVFYALAHAFCSRDHAHGPPRAGHLISIDPNLVAITMARRISELAAFPCRKLFLILHRVFDLSH